MLPSNGRWTDSRELDYHITNKEMQILLNYVKEHYALKFYILLCLVWCRGFRVSEALFINFRDFPLRIKGDFSKITYREAKTNKIRYNEIVPQPVAELIRDYILTNSKLLGHYEGYLFHRHNGKRNKGAPVMSTNTAGAFMAKWRNGLKKDHPEFAEKYQHISYRCKPCGWEFNTRNRISAPEGDLCPKCNKLPDTTKQWRYRIGWHSLRRNFEDNGLEYSNDNYHFVQQMMHYTEIEVVQHYASRRRIREKIPDFFKDHITPLFQKFERYDEAQTSLMKF